MKTTFKIQIAATFFMLLFGTSSCFDEVFIKGNGIVRTEYRTAEGFDEISSGGDFNVTVTPGSEYSVEVSAESNLLPYIETYVDGKTLKIKSRGLHSLRENYPIEVFITTPVLNGLAISGSGFIKTGSFMSNNFNISVSGSGDIDTHVSAGSVNANISGSGTIFIDGDADDTEFVVSGSGKIKAFDLVQKNCQAAISGSGDMYLNASEIIDARISGSGRIYYVNHPAIHSSISGSGSIIDKN